MKNYLLLIILPVIFTLYSFALKNADGPNYNYSLADPSYVYLLNSLSMSNLEGTGHTDHPGTPLQITGALIVKTYFFFTHEKDNITEDVIHRPEAYLSVLDHTLIIINAVGLFLAGLFILKIFKCVMAGMIFQTIPFASINILEVFSLVKPENFAFFLMVLQIVLIIKYVYDPESTRKNYYAYISGLLCGLIIAAKISFLCIVFLPLIIFPGIRQKINFVLLMLLAFVISILPVASNMDYFIKWVTDLFIHNGRYGSGDATIINSSDFFRNIQKIIYNEKFFFISYMFLFIATIFFIIKKKSSELIITSAELKLCIAILIAESVHILMVAKHYSSRYMFPALLLSVPALFITLNILYRTYLKKFGLKFLYAGLLAFLLLFGFYNGRKQLARSNNLNSESKKLTVYLNTEYKDASVILSPGVTNESAALLFAYYYTSEKSRPELKKYIDMRFPDLIWYDVFNEKMFPFSGTVPSDNMKPMLYQTTDATYNEGFIKNHNKIFNTENINLTEVFSNENGELIYRIDN